MFHTVRTSSSLRIFTEKFGLGTKKGQKKFMPSESVLYHSQPTPNPYLAYNSSTLILEVRLAKSWKRSRLSLIDTLSWSISLRPSKPKLMKWERPLDTWKYLFKNFYKPTPPFTIWMFIMVTSHWTTSASPLITRSS